MSDNQPLLRYVLSEPLCLCWCHRRLRWSNQHCKVSNNWGNHKTMKAFFCKVDEVGLCFLPFFSIVEKTPYLVGFKNRRFTGTGHSVLHIAGTMKKRR